MREVQSQRNKVSAVVLERHFEFGLLCLVWDRGVYLGANNLIEMLFKLIAAFKVSSVQSCYFNCNYSNCILYIN